VKQIKNAITRQRRGKQVSAATNQPATIEELLGAVFSMCSMWMLYKGDQLDMRVSRQSVGGRSRQLAVLCCIVSSRYLAITSEKTEGFMCALVVVM
jgi:hypothetical protein